MIGRFDLPFVGLASPVQRNRVGVRLFVPGSSLHGPIPADERRICALLALHVGAALLN